MDWAGYGEGLSERLVRVHEALQSGRYRARTVRRQWIAKSDGRQRPLGITCVEDKVVQQALVWILEAIYEPRFHRHSFGFRRARSAHQALSHVYSAITRRGKYSVVGEMDIEKFFDNVNHEKLMTYIPRVAA